MGFDGFGLVGMPGGPSESRPLHGLAPLDAMSQDDRRLWLIEALKAEAAEYADIEVPRGVEGQRSLLRGLFNVRPPMPVSSEFLAIQDAYLRGRIAEMGVTDASSLAPVATTGMDAQLAVWRGDITTLRVDGIVNAANSQMLGCFQANHLCIDNAIHTFAGVQLRLECDALMRAQGHDEPTGKAKITSGYNLPAGHVLHTVGPIVGGGCPSPRHRAYLASCYRSCLSLADEHGLSSIAFCCISTGVFGYPKRDAARTAVETVRSYKEETGSHIFVVFNVFGAADEAIYRELVTEPTSPCHDESGDSMFPSTWTTRPEQGFDASIDRLAQTISASDAVLVGAGAGLSVAAGFAYSGPRFEKTFSDFHERFGITDMYAGGFYPFPDPETTWAWWSRMVWVNRYDCPVGEVYRDLFTCLRDRDYFVLTTNVDHQFQRAGFDKHRLFYTQGDYGLFQCSTPCHQATYDNREQVERMLREQHDMRVPSELVPRCPVCGEPMTMNLRCDDTFVQDEGWYAAASRYDDFIRRHEGLKLALLELGVGNNTPGIIRYPFWQMAAANPSYTYAQVNYGEVLAPGYLDHPILIDADASHTVRALRDRLA